MKIKKFKAKNFAEALGLVKKELGENAIILDSEEKRGIRPFVEITAAVDYELVHASAVGQTSKRTEITTSDFGLNLASEIKKEIERLRDSIEGMKNNGYEMSMPTKKKMIFNYLRERAVREEYALRLCENAKDIREIPELIASDIKDRKNDFDKKAVMLIGPTGVGKTTTIAKLAANALKNAKRAAIVNLDTYRIGALEQIRIYAGILGIPLTMVSNTDGLKGSVLRHLETRDIVFIDTTGRNPRDEAYIKDILNICSTDIPMELHLLMSANSDDEFMASSYKFYSRLPLDCIAFTKVDEAVRFGSLYNLMFECQKPVAYITTGQRVPDDIEFVTRDDLANLILIKENYRC